MVRIPILILRICFSIFHVRKRLVYQHKFLLFSFCRCCCSTIRIYATSTFSLYVIFDFYANIFPIASLIQRNHSTHIAHTLMQIVLKTLNKEFYLVIPFLRIPRIHFVHDYYFERRKKIASVLC